MNCFFSCFIDWRHQCLRFLYKHIVLNIECIRHTLQRLYRIFSYSFSLWTNSWYNFTKKIEEYLILRIFNLIKPQILTTFISKIAKIDVIFLWGTELWYKSCILLLKIFYFSIFGRFWWQNYPVANSANSRNTLLLHFKMNFSNDCKVFFPFIYWNFIFFLEKCITNISISLLLLYIRMSFIHILG